MLITRNDHVIQDLLTTARVIAVVGHSDRTYRTSYQIAGYLRRVGYTVYPVNPEVTSINGMPCYPSLADVPEPVDIVNVFRRAEYLPDIIEQAIKITPKVVWAQLGIYSDEAAQIAEAAKLPLVMNACIKVEHRRLIGA